MFAKRNNLKLGLAIAAMCGRAMPALALDTQTTASAGSNGRGSGTAAATANYTGDGIGFARTQADTGKVNFARGLAVGLDENGLSLSNSFAVAPQYGPAIGGTFNVHIGTDGGTTVSTGRVTADGDRNRSVNVGGSAGGNRFNQHSIATASGNTGPRGEVRAETHSVDRPGYRFAAGRPVRSSGSNWR
jgi:hypothetical protein